MNISTSYLLTEADYLAFSLYNASTSKRIKKNARKEWFLVTLSFFLLACCFMYDSNSSRFFIFLGINILVSVLFPFYSKWRYKKHYSMHIKELWEGRSGLVSDISFTDDTVEIKNETEVSKVNLSQIREIHETEKYYFLQQAPGYALVIPKERLQNPSDIDKAIKEIASKFNIKYVVNMKWGWKLTEIYG